MRIPDYAKACVAFLCVEKDNALLYGGTAFHVIMRSQRLPEEMWFAYLVTAKHSVYRAYSQYGHLKLRMNAFDKAHLFDLEPGRWVYPEDPNVDVAVLQTNLDPLLEVFCFEMNEFATKDRIVEFGIGIGDETTTIGLFTQHHGKKRNIPILRSGIIAAMSEEEIFDSKTAQLFHAYLIEVRSVGGLSGSPVLVSVPPHRCKGLNAERPSDGMSIPFGLIRGHWNIGTSGDGDFASGETLHSGIAMVTPIQEVHNLIMTNKHLTLARTKMEDAFIAGELTIEELPFRMQRPR